MNGEVRTGEVRAPGRVNLIGEHTDYQEGFCLPAAIDREVRVEWVAREDEIMTITSTDFHEVATFTIAGGSRSNTPIWARPAQAMANLLVERGCNRVGIDATVSSSVPIGAGLSSSAAFTVAFGLAVAAAANFAIDKTDLAIAAQAAERRATGVPCGLMDQLVSVHGKTGNALLLDCRTRDVTAVPIPTELAVVVAHCGVPRLLADTEYAQRRAAVEEAAAKLGVRTLRDASPEDVRNDPYARHVVSENRRTLMFVAALRRGRLDELGVHLLASHTSLRDDFSVSTPSLDALVDSFMHAGAIGARLTGAGFGGSVVAVCHASDATRVVELTAERYVSITGITTEPFVVTASDGARHVDKPE